jgi:hypothetical protein
VTFSRSARALIGNESKDSERGDLMALLESLRGEVPAKFRATGKVSSFQ